MQISSQQANPPRLQAGSAAAALAVVIWACPSVLGKALPLEALPLVFYRGWLGVLWGLAMLYLVRGRLSVRILRLSAPAGIALGLDLIFFFSAIKLTTVANATMISALQPLLLLFLAPLLFQERIRLPDVAAALVAIGGVGLVAFGSQGQASWSLRGDGYAVLTLIAWTGYLIASKRVRGSLRAVEFTAGVMVTASLLVTPFVLLTGPALTWPEPIHWLGLAAMAISGWFGHVLMNWALGHIPIWVGGSAALAVPVVATGLAAYFLDEAFLPIQAVGMVVVVVALTVVGVRSPQVLGTKPST